MQPLEIGTMGGRACGLATSSQANQNDKKSLHGKT